jgi:hypothetical protein
MSLSIGDANQLTWQHNEQIRSLRAVYENVDGVREEVKKLTATQEYMRNLEAKVSKLELSLKENQEAHSKSWFASVTRRAYIIAKDLWVQKFNEVTVPKDLTDFSKNKLENYVRTDNEEFLKLVQNALRLIIADACNRGNNNGLYAEYEAFAKETVIGALQTETRAEKWLIEKVLTEQPLRPEDRELAIVKEIGKTNPQNVIGPLAMAML